MVDPITELLKQAAQLRQMADTLEAAARSLDPQHKVDRQAAIEKWHQKIPGGWRPQLSVVGAKALEDDILAGILTSAELCKKYAVSERTVWDYRQQLGITIPRGTRRRHKIK